MSIPHFFICFVFTLLLPNGLWAQVDPQIKWKTLETTHFKIIFDAKQLELAKIYLEQAETAYNRLEPLFHSAPEKTYLILKDNTDQSNGSASAIPYPYMELYPIQPHLDSNIGYYENWAQLLTTHEFTHILNLEPTNGGAKYLRYVFGSIIKPNMLLPRWYTEGLAVELEAYFSNTGRLRSPLYDGSIRSKVYQADWGNQNLAQINDPSSPEWPYGSKPYFYGALIWHQMHTEFKSSFIEKLNIKTSSTLPYPPDNSLYKLKAINFDRVLEKTYSQYEEAAAKQLFAIEKSATKYKHISEDKFGASKPQFIDETHFLYLRTNDHSLIELVMAELSTENKIVNKTILFMRPQIIDFQYNKKTNEIYYITNSTFKRYYNFNDLWSYNLKSKKHKALTKGERLNSFRFNPEEQIITYSRFHNGKYQLKVFNLKSQKVGLVYTSKIYEYISDPHFHKGNYFFLHKKNNSLPRLVKFSPTKNQLITLIDKDIIQINMTDQGILFIQREPGFQNAYIWKNKQIKQLTNSISIIKDCDLITKKLLCAELTANSWQLNLQKYKVFQPIKTPKSISYSERKLNTPIKSTSKYKIDDYSSFEALYPHYWIPFIYSNSGGSGFSLNISGNDPLNLHLYAASLLYDTLNQDFGYSLSYLNQSISAPLSIFAAKYLTYINATEETVTDYRYQIGFSSFIHGLKNNWQFFGFGRFYETLEESAASTRRIGIGASISYNDIKPDVWYKINPETGTSFNLSHIEYIKQNDYTDYSSTELSLLKYFSPSFFPKRHALKTKLNAIYSPSNGRSLRTGILSTITTEESIFASSIPNIRGYLSGNFLAYSSALASLQYDFPISYFFDGYHSLPLFFQKMSLGFFVDSGSFDGAYYYDSKGPLVHTDLDKFYTGIGTELGLKITVFYHLPLWLRLSVARGDIKTAGGGYHYYLSLGI